MRAGIAGELLKVGNANLFDRSKIVELAQRPDVDIKAVGKGPLAKEKIFVVRVGPKEPIDPPESHFRHDPPGYRRSWKGWSEQEKGTPEALCAVGRWWTLGSATKADIRDRVGRLGFQPFVVTVKSVVVATFDSAIDFEDGADTSFKLEPASDWKTNFEKHWLRTRRGAPWVLENAKDLG